MAGGKKLVAIAGATAVGKTAVSIELARHFNTAILSYDSRQCYQELEIGVARPGELELQQVPHYFIASHSIHTPVDAAAYEQYALGILQTLFSHHEVVIAVGGTGLYLKAICEGMDAMPDIDLHLRQSLRIEYELKGLQWLQDTLTTADPLYAASGEMQNPHRMLRALEVICSSGKSIRHFQQNQQVTRDFSTIKIGIELPREELVKRIDHRVDQMMKDGLEAEAKSLFPQRQLQALQTVGYQEMFEYFETNCSLAEAIASIKTHTRQYAKRQMTWFKKDTAMNWFSANNSADILVFLNKEIA